MEQFDVPVVLFTFKRSNTLPRIFEVIRMVQPKKIYIFSDGGRNDQEWALVNETRALVLSLIDWPCEVVKMFADTNQGVFNQIGLGAKAVLGQEKEAIFIEDDNLPSVSFFGYCKSMLKRYEESEKVLWVCGTNYECESDYLTTDYVFTKHMLPCGWASWSWKFNKYYETSFSRMNHKQKCKLYKNYEMKALYFQQIRNFKSEKYREQHGMRFASWDYHMAYSIRLHDLYGIAPKINLIKNIGVDELSTHGGTTLDHPNTSKFCEIPNLEFKKGKLIGPKNIEINKQFEKKTGKIILVPLKIRLLFPLITFMKKLLRIYPNGSLSAKLKRR